jgi:hypothetical protein
MYLQYKTVMCITLRILLRDNPAVEAKASLFVHFVKDSGAAFEATSDSRRRFSHLQRDSAEWNDLRKVV